MSFLDVVTFAIFALFAILTVTLVWLVAWTLLEARKYQCARTLETDERRVRHELGYLPDRDRNGVMR